MITSLYLLRAFIKNQDEPIETIVKITIAIKAGMMPTQVTVYGKATSAIPKNNLYILDSA